MAAIPPSAMQEIINRMYESYEAQEPHELYLGRLGSSSIGNECNRAIWLNWRAYAKSQFGGRMLRLFATGHLQEDRIVVDLRAAGFTVWSVDPQGNQFQWLDESGHFITKIDGIIKGVPGSVEKPHLLEIKTHNKSSFAAVQKHGVQKSKPTHYAQVQISMKLAEIDRTIYVALCKDDEQFYVERIKQDRTEQKLLNHKIIQIHSATLKPAGISDDKASFSCKFCDMKDVCYGDVTPLCTCRSCVNSVAIEDGEWMCGLNNLILDKDAQRTACPQYELL